MSHEGALVLEGRAVRKRRQDEERLEGCHPDGVNRDPEPPGLREEGCPQRLMRSSMGSLLVAQRWWWMLMALEGRHLAEKGAGIEYNQMLPLELREYSQNEMILCERFCRQFGR